ncbi:MAG: sulfide dehydrogenase [Gammaproteobacteria bacterium]|nr:sulfide dehydrogenase [Gammaproteobacteria bacterium]
MWVTKPGARMLAASCLALMSFSTTAEPVSEGAMLSITCNGCHGPDGKSTGSIPAIGGKSADYIEKALLDFRDDKRPSTVMKRHAKGYSDAQIKLIAEYFAAKK